MTNREFYKEQILDIVCNGETIAFNKDKNEPCACSCLSCTRCLFKSKEYGCAEMLEEWCKAEYVESCPFEEGELVEVSDDGILWFLRYFSHIDNSVKYKYFKYFTYSDQNKTGNIINWKYCKKYGTLGGLVKENVE